MYKKMAPADLDHILAHTYGLWDELSGRRVFITGGTGFFGRWLLESLAWVNEKLALNASLTVLSRDPEAFRRQAPQLCANPAISLVTGDVRSFAFPDGEYPFVVHGATAASAKTNADEPQQMYDTIEQGTRRTLDFAVQARCRKFLFISSGAVYGRQPSEMTHIPESYQGGPNPMNSSSAYGEGKRAAELLCALYHHNHPTLEPKIARCFTFVGPYLPLDAHFAIGNFIRDALGGGPIVVKGDGTPYRSYLYAADLAIWLWTILFRAPTCRPYNVGSGEAVTILETACAVAETTTPPLPVTVAQTPANLPPQRYVPSVSRAKIELGLEPRIELTEAIHKTANFHTQGVATSNHHARTLGDGGVVSLP